MSVGLAGMGVSPVWSDGGLSAISFYVNGFDSSIDNAGNFYFDGSVIAAGKRGLFAGLMLPRSDCLEPEKVCLSACLFVFLFWFMSLIIDAQQDPSLRQVIRFLVCLSSHS